MVLKIGRAAALMLFSAVASAQQPKSERGPRPLLYGFALECVGCQPGMGARGRSGGPGSATGVSTPAGYPHVIAVAPGTSAARAGIRPGDELHTIDGRSVLSKEGVDRLDAAAPGETVVLGFERDAKPVSFSLVLGAPTLSAPQAGREILLGYASIMGNVHGEMHLDFWSDEPIYVVPDSATGAINFQIGKSTVLRMRIVKDSTDPANRPDKKKGAPDWF